MQMQEATWLEELENKALDIKRVNAIFQQAKGNAKVESMIAMNLSLRTSVYEPLKGKSEEMSYLLEQLAHSQSMEARWAVAKNPHTSLEVLTLLSKDKINLVRALVACNPRTPTEILEDFFTDEKIVRDGLSGNPNTSEKLLDTLADDSDKMVRLRVAENPSTSKATLEKLTQDSVVDVQKAALKNR